MHIHMKYMPRRDQMDTNNVKGNIYLTLTL